MLRLCSACYGGSLPSVDDESTGGAPTLDYKAVALQVTKMGFSNPDLIGWFASALLVLTLSRQIYTQSRDASARGVSRWLFAGQIVSSCGFIAYSVLLHNLVFIITNTAILITAVVGQVVLWRRKSKG